jgi:Mce-associated membrane protein
VTDIVTDAPQPVRPSFSPRARIAIGLLAGLVVLLAGSAVALALVVKAHLDDRHALTRARDDALVAARQEIVNLDSLSADTVDAGLKLVLDGATGTFKDQFSRSQADLKTLIVNQKTVSSGSILSAGVVRADTSTVTVLIGVDRTVRDSSTPQGAVAHDRWRVDLEKHGGRWLVANLQPVA